jgi:hypothetical protein
MMADIDTSFEDWTQYLDLDDVLSVEYKQCITGKGFSERPRLPFNTSPSFSYGKSKYHA